MQHVTFYALPFMLSVSLRLPSTEGSSSRASQSGKWISALGWVMTAGALVSAFIGFSDLANLTLLAVAGVVFIPIGLLLVTNGRILSKLTNMEKNARNPDGPSG